MTMHTRTFALQRAPRAADDETTDPNAFEFALSSEAPYERWFGIEILEHTPEAVDLSRLADGRHPLLVQHDTDRQAGVIRSAWLDAEARMVRVSGRFSRGALGQEIRQDYEDDIRTLVSVGYMIEEVKEVKRGADGAEQCVRTLTGEQYAREFTSEDAQRRSAGEARGKGHSELPVYRVTRWQPFEGSIVSIPADVTVGKGRAAEPPTPPAQREDPPQPKPVEIVIMSDTNPQPSTNEQRVAAIVDLGEKYSKYVSQKDVAAAVRDGTTVDKFLEKIVEQQSSRHTDTSSLHIGMSRGEASRYSFGKLVRALTLKADGVGNAMKDAGFELECSRAFAQMIGRDPEGVFVPYEAFARDFNVGTSTEAGNLVATDLRTDMYFDVLRAAMVFPALGARVLTGLTSSIAIPYKSAAGSLAGLTEIGSASETAPTIGQLTLSPKRVGAYVEVSKQAIIQSSLALEPLLRDDLVTGAAVQIENYAIQGSSAANGTGILYRTGIGTVSEANNGTAVSWDVLVDLEGAPLTANAAPDALSGYLINTAIRQKAKKVQKGTNLNFVWDNGPNPLNGYRAAITNNVPKNLTKGTSTTVASGMVFSTDWSMMVLGFFGGLDVTVDPYSKADTGQVKITLNQFWDYTVRQPSAFAQRKDVLTA